MIRNWFKPRSDSIQRREVLTEESVRAKLKPTQEDFERIRDEVAAEENIKAKCEEREALWWSELPAANGEYSCVKCGGDSVVRSFMRMTELHSGECSFARIRNSMFLFNGGRYFHHSLPAREVLRVSCATCAHLIGREHPLDAEVEEP